MAEARTGRTAPYLLLALLLAETTLASARVPFSSPPPSSSSARPSPSSTLLPLDASRCHGTECPVGSTCCPTAQYGNATYACCTAEKAVCCADGLHCCPEGYACEASNGTCSALHPNYHRYDAWQPQYSLCNPGPALPLVRLPIAPNLAFPYYTNMPPLGTPAPGIRIVVVVVHGAARNADAYYCGMVESAQLQTFYPPEAVGVIAVRFMQPEDSPASGLVFWSGEDPNGVWRAGYDSDPAADPAGGFTISSYAVLDKFLAALAVDSKSLYPDLEAVTFAGHSSGGQTVQRYAFSTHINTLDIETSIHLRFVVANPSSYVYFDGRRWIDDQLVVPPADDIANCTAYNNWEWGLAGNFTPYVNLSVEPSPKYVLDRYRSLDVVYLLGNNDTCNEQITPGCSSHGLETTCMDNFEGPMRLYRGLHYFYFLSSFYGSAVHRYQLVPNVGHDNALMFQATEGLDTIFCVTQACQYRHLFAYIRRAIPVAVLLGVCFAILIHKKAQLAKQSPYRYIRVLRQS